MISAIIVAYNEEKLIPKIIEELRNQDFPGDYEILLADGGSDDRTRTLAAERGIKVKRCRKGRAMQMNDAGREANGNVLFFVHADMQLPKNTFSAIGKKMEDGYDGGGFTNKFDSYNSRIKKLGNLMNFRFFDMREQSDKGIFYGDNGIFVKKRVFEELNGFKEISIMEDYDFSKRLKEKYSVIKIKEPQIVVSARRHLKAGFLKTRFQWIMIRKLYQWGIAPKKLERWYGEVR